MTPDKVEAALGVLAKQEQFAGWDKDKQAFREALSVLTEALAEMERDAARYRFIRDSKSGGRVDLCVCLVFWEQQPVQYMIRTEDRADAAIDAAMKETP